MIRNAVWALVCCIVFPWGALAQQQKMVKILVTSPQITEKAYRPIADVFAGSIIRELSRNGGLQVVDREKSEEYLRGKGLSEGVDNREIAIEVGKALGADIVIYSTISKNYETFAYSLAFLEVERDVIQRILRGSFSESVPPFEIAKLVKNDVSKFEQYIPLPSELANPGLILRQETVNPESLPKSVNIEIPRMDRFGCVEQVFTYYRVFPGELEYVKINTDQQITRIQMEPDEDLDEDLVRIMTRLQMYGEFALRYNLQAYLIKNCSVRTVNVLLANKVPVFYSDDGENVVLLTGYYGLRTEGFCIFRTNYNDEFESFDLIHRKLICVLIILPKPGKKGGISREYLDTAVSRFQNDWGKSPTLVEIEEGFFDIISSGLEN